MIREELRQLDTSPRALRRFGWMVGGVFILIGAWLAYRGHRWAPAPLGGGLVLAVAGWFMPRRLVTVYRAWMALALVLGLVVTTVLLTLVFCLVVTPAGWLARLKGKDFLHRRLDRSAATYWEVRPRAPARSPQDYEKQY